MLLKLQRPYNLHLYSLINFPKTELTKKLIDDNLIQKDNSIKALTQWRMSLRFNRNKKNLYYNCLVSLLSKSFVPKAVIKVFSKNLFSKKYLNLLVILTSFCNKIKIVFTGSKYIFSGKISYATFKYYVKNIKELIN